MSRLPARPRDALSSEQQEVDDTFRQVLNRSFGRNGEKFIYEDNGGLIGPFPFFIAAPKVGKILHDLVYGLVQLPLPSDARETAIMTVGGHFQARYETHSHLPQAVDSGLSPEQAEILQTGDRKPDGLNEQCDIAYDVGQHLVSMKGPLPQHLWDRSVETLGKDGSVALLHYIGFYCYVCVALNGVDAPIPE